MTYRKSLNAWVWRRRPYISSCPCGWKSKHQPSHHDAVVELAQHGYETHDRKARTLKCDCGTTLYSPETMRVHRGMFRPNGVTA